MGLFRRSAQHKLDKQLAAAAAQGDAAETARLLDLGANADSCTSYNPPLFEAAYRGDDPRHHETLRLLLSRGATVDLRNKGGCTALHGAANKGYPGAVKILLEAGADPALTGKGSNALDWAKISGHWKTIALLVKPEAPPRPPPAEKPDEITLRRPIGDRLLEEVYDFAGRERITLIRKEEGGAVEAVTREGFSAIENRGRLREAFTAYVRKGGAIPESEIFPENMAKIKIPRPGG